MRSRRSKRIEHKHTLEPDDVAMQIVSRSWRRLVEPEPSKVNRHAHTFCALEALRDSLRWEEKHDPERSAGSYVGLVCDGTRAAIRSRGQADPAGGRADPDRQRSWLWRDLRREGGHRHQCACGGGREQPGRRAHWISSGGGVSTSSSRAVTTRPREPATLTAQPPPPPSSRSKGGGAPWPRGIRLPRRERCPWGVRLAIAFRALTIDSFAGISGYGGAPVTPRWRGEPQMQTVVSRAVTLVRPDSRSITTDARHRAGRRSTTGERGALRQGHGERRFAVR